MCQPAPHLVATLNTSRSLAGLSPQTQTHPSPNVLTSFTPYTIQVSRVRIRVRVTQYFLPRPPQGRAAKRDTLAEIVEAERQIMLWERKIALEKEMAEVMDPTVGQDVVGEMKKEIHRMTLRHAELMRLQVGEGGQRGVGEHGAESKETHRMRHDPGHLRFRDSLPPSHGSSRFTCTHPTT